MASSEFTIKDSGARQEFASGMVRDTTEGKIDWTSLLWGPMLRRWADHLTKGRKKYADPAPGVPNWTLAEGPEELARFKASAFRHFMAWIDGETDEDHASGVFFNINGAEYVKANMAVAVPEPLSDEMSPSWDKPWHILPGRWTGDPTGFAAAIECEEHDGLCFAACTCEQHGIGQPRWDWACPIHGRDV